MSIWSGLSLLAIFWCLVHIVHRFKRSKLPSSLLPLQLSSRARTTTTNISLHSLHLKIFTTRWNSRHDELSSALSKRGNKTLSTAFRWFYDLGSVSGAFGMLIALTGLFWIFVTSGSTLFHKISAHGVDPSSHGQPLFKRALESLTDTAQNSQSQFITAIVSGHPWKAQGRF
jgi:S2P endopeptidase